MEAVPGNRGSLFHVSGFRPAPSASPLRRGHGGCCRRRRPIPPKGSIIQSQATPDGGRTEPNIRSRLSVTRPEQSSPRCTVSVVRQTRSASGQMVQRHQARRDDPLAQARGYVAPARSVDVHGNDGKLRQQIGRGHQVGPVADISQDTGDPGADLPGHHNTFRQRPAANRAGQGCTASTRLTPPKRPAKALRARRRGSPSPARGRAGAAGWIPRPP